MVIGLRTRFSVVIVALFVVLATGCASGPPAIESDAAQELQSSVLAVTTASAEGDIVEALAQLDALEVLVREGTASGAITPAQSARIQASIQLVRTDLLAALPEPAPPAVSGDTQSGTGEGDSDGNSGKDSSNNGNENNGNNGNNGNGNSGNSGNNGNGNNGNDD